MQTSSLQRSSPAGQTANRVGSNLWYGDVKRSLQANLRAYGSNVWLITVTAPGSSVLPCAHESCGHKPAHVQRSANGCYVEPALAREWNRTASKRLSEMHRRAIQIVRRKLDARSPVLAGVWQEQERGVLHAHLVLGFNPDDQAASKLYVATMKSLVAEWNFGYIDARDRAGKSGKSTVLEPHRAAGYLSKYLGESSQLARAVALKDRPRRLVWVSRRLTSSSKVTMRRLRRTRHLWAHRQGYCPPPAWAVDVVELMRVSMLIRTPALAQAP